jgi:hypothetical protein
MAARKMVGYIKRSVNFGQQSLTRGSGSMTLLRLGLPLFSWRAPATGSVRGLKLLSRSSPSRLPARRAASNIGNRLREKITILARRKCLRERLRSPDDLLQAICVAGAQEDTRRIASPLTAAANR